MNTAVRREITEDRRPVCEVNLAAFATGDEAELVNALRDGGYVEVSLVAEVDRKIVGHILLSRVTIETKAGSVDAFSLAPMAVVPSFQRQGIGSALVEAGLEACRAEGHKILVVLGHPDFYPRFGFSAELARTLQNPFGEGEAWMATELKSGALAGIEGRVEYPPPFMMFE